MSAGLKHQKPTPKLQNLSELKCLKASKTDSTLQISIYVGNLHYPALSVSEDFNANQGGGEGIFSPSLGFYSITQKE